MHFRPHNRYVRIYLIYICGVENLLCISSFSTLGDPFGFCWPFWVSSQWRNNQRDGVPKHQPHARLFTQPLIQGVDQRKHQSSASPGLCAGNLWPVNFPHKGPVTRKMFPFDDVIMVHRPVSIELNSAISSQVTRCTALLCITTYLFVLYIYWNHSLTL